MTNNEGWCYTWKEIAIYIGCSVRTAKKYYYKGNLPVKRPLGRVAAIKQELDLWLIEHDKAFTNITPSFHHHFTIIA